MKTEVNNLSLLVSAANGAVLLGISRSSFYAMHSSGRLGPLPVHLGSRTLWRRQELAEWVFSGCPGRQKWNEIK